MLEPAARAEISVIQLADDRLGGRPHVEMRVELARDALDDDHRLLQQHESEPGRHVEQRR